ncbi:pyruvate kinase [Thioalkalicoccus limnaeus]|uniref:Pyruvate kinase n=1 Tax=Thioalkalicoccus limnaeus TaxID=120681 RepID=A0ABV4BFK7_9GAMM
MQFPSNKTKIVATIGPASEDPEVLREMILAGLNVARLNFSHGDEDYHSRLIGRIRAAANEVGRRVAIMGDLPGPKMRIGDLAEEPIELNRDATIRLTTDEVSGSSERVSVSFPGLPAAVRPGDRLFLNDGFILLKVVEVTATDVICRIRVGGELRSRKGLNLPGIDLGLCAFTDNDQKWLGFAATHRLDAVSQSFVANAADIHAVRRAANALDYTPFLIAKIERAGALDHLDEILEASDGLMVARGDLGVEIPIEQIAVTQKRIMDKANRAGKPVITATQMLESMVTVSRPTRAEATDVANAILDGTDCVMLSAESAMGRYPVESVAMLASIAAAVEPERPWRPFRPLTTERANGEALRAVDLIAESVYHTIERSLFQAVLVPTRSGDTARNVARFRLPVWIIALSPNESTCQALSFSYGILPIAVDVDRADWSDFARTWLATQGVRDGLVLLTQGPSAENPRGNHRMEILELGAQRRATR